MKLQLLPLIYSQIRQFPLEIFAHSYGPLWGVFGISNRSTPSRTLGVKIAFLCFGGCQNQNFYNIKCIFFGLK